MGSQKAVDPRIFFLVEPERKRCRQFLDLLGTAPAHNGGSDGRMVERPGDRDHSRGTPCPLPISRSSSTRRRLRLKRGSLNSTARLRQSSAGKAATRSAVILPVRRPETIGE